MIDFLLGSFVCIICSFVCLFVCFILCLSVSPSIYLVSFCQPLRYADKRIVNIIKSYIEMNNFQVELIRLRKKVDFIRVYSCEATDPMQYRPPNAILL